MEKTEAAQAQLAVMLQEDQRTFEKKNFENCKFSDIQKYLRSLSKANPVPNEVYLDGSKANLASEKANLFVKYFQYVFSATEPKQ